MIQALLLLSFTANLRGTIGPLHVHEAEGAGARAAHIHAAQGADAPPAAHAHGHAERHHHRAETTADLAGTPATQLDAAAESADDGTGPGPQGALAWATPRALWPAERAATLYAGAAPMRWRDAERAPPEHKPRG